MTEPERLRLKSYIKSLRKRGSLFEVQARQRFPELPLRQSPEGGEACALRLVASELEAMLAEFGGENLERRGEDESQGASE